MKRPLRCSAFSVHTYAKPVLKTPEFFFSPFLSFMFFAFFRKKIRSLFQNIFFLFRAAHKTPSPTASTENFFSVMQTYKAHACGWSRHQPPATLLRYGAIRIFRVLQQPPASALNTFHQSSCLRRASTTFPRNIYTRNLPFFQAPLSFRKNPGSR